MVDYAWRVQCLHSPRDHAGKRPIDLVVDLAPSAMPETL